MSAGDLTPRIDPNVQIIEYLNQFFRLKRSDLQEESLRRRFNFDQDQMPSLDDFRLFGDKISLGFNRSWESPVALLKSDGSVDSEIFDLDAVLNAKLDAIPVGVTEEATATLYFTTLFRETGNNPFYIKPRVQTDQEVLQDIEVPYFAELSIGLAATGLGNDAIENGFLKISQPINDGKIRFYREEDSSGEVAGSFLFMGQTVCFKRPVENIKFNLRLSEADNPPSDFSGLDFSDSMVGLGVEAFRVYGTKRVPAFEYGIVESADASINAIEMGRHLEESGKLAISFFELRGEKDPYTGCARTVFIFRCWGSPESDARALWMLLDQALHNKFNEYWGDLFVYSSVRRDMPELSLTDELVHLNAFNFMCAYDIVYWEYDDE